MTQIDKKNPVRLQYIDYYCKENPCVPKVFIENLVDSYLVNPDSFKDMCKKDMIKQRKGKETVREIPATITSVEITPADKKESLVIEDIPECSIQCLSSV